MLVLERKTGESIRIGQKIRLTVLSHNDTCVRLELDDGRHKAVLTRRVGMMVLHNKDIYINTTRHQGFLRFGIEADRSIEVWREELWLKMNQVEHSGKAVPAQREVA